jgi:hypothetical protein
VAIFGSLPLLRGDTEAAAVFLIHEEEDDAE